MGSRYIDPDDIRSILNGLVSYLGHAFVWSDTPQGFEFWSDQFLNSELTEEGRIALLEMLHG